MKNKGQAAMEFLMTYGWAILAGIIAIGVLAYFGVFNTEGMSPYENGRSDYKIYLNGSEVNNITYKTVNSIKMIEEGDYPGYIFCYSYCLELGASYNSSEIFNQCNGGCEDNYGIEELISIYELNEEWLEKNCISEMSCATDVYGNPTDECMGNYQ